MKRWPESPLSELCDINIGRTPSRNEPKYWGPGEPWLSIADMSQGRFLSSTKEQITPEATQGVMGASAPAGTVALSFKLSIGKVGLTKIPMYTNEAIATLPIKNSDLLSEDFLYWALRSIDLTQGTDDAVMGKTLNKSKLARVKIPLPPRSAQQKIVSVLDYMDKVQDKRRRSIELLDELTQSIFLDIFGDARSPGSQWNEIPFAEALTEPPRNGLSPSKGGSFSASVLTLSAVTGENFNPHAQKEATFKETPPSNKSVRKNDFLVCRGNGNVDLVGRGYFPKKDMPNMTFPDTIISSPVDQEKLYPKFLETLWKQEFIRDQVKSVARTTNGTFKINQRSLENIRIIVPPIDIQRNFSKKVQKIENLKAKHLAHLSHLDELFASVQQRAFNGTLWDDPAVAS